ncbi:serine O-acetyltransferase [Gammaproteobacteria bacterium]|nr:serine O-acetyltransferase [Gammaproteobacteria bacterium]
MTILRKPVTAPVPLDLRVVPTDLAGIWQSIREDATVAASNEPLLASFLHASVLRNNTLFGSLSLILADKLGSQILPAVQLREVFDEVLAFDALIAAVVADLVAVRDRDPACNSYSLPLLYFKGFHALQAHRINHYLYTNGHRGLAFYLHNRQSEVFGVDIHPAARFGHGVMIDHATGLVIGETAVIGNDVSIYQSVTLGGTGKDGGDRHPKIGNEVLLGAGAKLLGNIRIGDRARVAAGSVVLIDVPACCTVAGVPAKVVRGPDPNCCPGRDLDQCV